MAKIDNTIPTGYEAIARRAERRRALAEALQARAVTPGEGQQTALSPFIKIAEAFLANKVDRQADAEFDTYVNARRGQAQQEVGDLTDFLAKNPEATGAQVAQMGATYSSPVAQAIMNNYMERDKENLIGGVKAKDIVNLRGADGTVTSGTQMQNGQIVPMAGGMREALPLVNVNDVGVDALTFDPAKQAPQNPTDIVIRGEPKPGEVVGDMQINPLALVGKEKLALAGRPISQIINPSESQYSKTFGEGIAKADLGVIEAGRNAPELIRQGALITNLLAKKPITGTFAEQLLWVNRAAATAGLIDPEQVANTEVLGTTLAKQVLANVKASNLGAGNGFSNTDREFVEKASAGSIKFTPQTIARVAQLSIRAGKLAQQRAKSMEAKAGRIPGVGAVADQASSLDPSGVLDPATQSLVDKYRKR